LITKLLTIQQLRKARTTWAIGISILLLTATVPTLSHAIEEPTYQVVRDIAGVEIRQYAAYTVAEVVVPGPSSEAGNQAFPILAGYIFGKNKGERKFAMTAPVTQTPEPVKMAMTAPVTQSTTQGGYLVQFVLPKGVSQTNAPEPLDRRVQVRDVLPKQVAVIRFSGVWSESNYQEHLEKLQTALRTANFMWEGEPVYSRYNAPLTPWFLRRNEIWLNLPTQP
jgi:SOUL heme-binding protein